MSDELRKKSEEDEKREDERLSRSDSITHDEDSYETNADDADSVATRNGSDSEDNSNELEETVIASCGVTVDSDDDMEDSASSDNESDENIADGAAEEKTESDSNADESEAEDTDKDNNDSEKNAAGAAKANKAKMSREDRKRAKEIEKKRKAREKKSAKAAKHKAKLEKKRAKNPEYVPRSMRRHRHATKSVAMKEKRRNVWLLVLLAAMLAFAAYLAYPPQDKINKGLDIQGGLSVVLSAQSTDGNEVTDEDMETSREIIESRVNALGASEATVSIQGTDQILVQIPGMTDAEDALNTIGKTGQLTFARLDSFTDEDVKDQIDSGQYMTADTFSDGYGNTFQTGDVEYMEVDPDIYTPLVTGDHIERVTVDRASETSSDYAVNIEFDSEGTAAFAAATSELASSQGKIVIILDNEVQSAPAVQSEITDGNVSITGGYTQDEANAMKTVLDSGSLPVSFTYEQSQVVGPTLGQGELEAGLLAMAIGIAIVLIYLLFFYRGFGIIIVANMGVLALLYVGILAGLSSMGLFSLSLAGLAGIILTVGMAADSSILVIERFIEELKMGRSVKSCSKTAVQHGIYTSIDADIVTLISALALFFLASASVKGFGLTLALGIICDIIVMLIFKAPIIRLLAPKIINNHKGFWGIRKAYGFGQSHNESVLLNGLKKKESMPLKDESTEKNSDRKEENGTIKESNTDNSVSENKGALGDNRKQMQGRKKKPRKQRKKEAQRRANAINAKKRAEQRRNASSKGGRN